MNESNFLSSLPYLLMVTGLFFILVGAALYTMNRPRGATLVTHTKRLDDRKSSGSTQKSSGSQPVMSTSKYGMNRKQRRTMASLKRKGKLA